MTSATMSGCPTLTLSDEICILTVSFAKSFLLV
jgi:hypothetical protein